MLQQTLNDKDELQHELSRVAGHLISLEYNGQLQREPDVFEAIEQLYIEGEADVKEAVTTGLFLPITKSPVSLLKG